MTKNKRKLYYIVNGKVLKVRTKTKYNVGDDLCWNHETQRFAKHSAHHERNNNWQCNVGEVMRMPDKKENWSFGSIWAADIYVTGKSEDLFEVLELKRSK
jgi:hypothetical protein